MKVRKLNLDENLDNLSFFYRQGDGTRGQPTRKAAELFAPDPSLKVTALPRGLSSFCFAAWIPKDHFIADMEDLVLSIFSF